MFTPILVFGQDQVYFSETWTQDGGESALFYKNSSTTDNIGNVYMAGSAININNNHDIIVQKFDPDGGLLWEETFNGAANMDDFAADIFVDDNYNVFVTGSSVKLVANDQDLVVLKYNSSGVFQWYSYYDNGGSPTPKDFGTSITGDNNGSVYVTGGSFGATSNSDFITLGIASNNGTQLWEKRYDYAALQDVAAKIKYDGNNLFVSGGSQINFNRWELATLTYNPLNGDQLYEKRSQGNATQGVDEVYDLTVDNLGNVYIAGAVRNLNSGYDMSVYKLDPQLNILWEKHHDGYGADDKGKGVKVDDLGNVYVAGFVSNPNEGKNYSLLKYNSSGVLQWAREFNGQANLDDEAVQLVIANNQDIFVTGTARNKADSDIQTLGYKPNGELFTQAIFEGVNGFDDLPTGITIDMAENIIVVGKMGEANGYYRDVTVKYSLYLKPFSPVIVNGEPSHNANEVIIRFDRSSVNYAAIDRKGFVAGKLSDFVKPSVISLMNEKLKMKVGDLSTFKIFRNMTTADSLSVTRLGDTIKVDDFWATLSVVFPNNVNIEDEIDRLSELKDLIFYSEKNLLGRLHDVIPNDPYFSLQQLYTYKQSGLYGGAFGIEMVSLSSGPTINLIDQGAWQFEVGKPSIKVGVFDTGINWRHEDLGNGTWNGSRVKGGWDYGKGVPPSGQNNSDSGNHGTAVAGIIGAIRNNGIGVSGIAGGDFEEGLDGVSLYSLRITDTEPFDSNDSLFQTTTAAEAIIHGALDSPQTNFGLGLHVHNYSWSINNDVSGFDTIHRILRNAVNEAFKNEVVQIASSGNIDPNNYLENPDTTFYPASFNDEWILKTGASRSGERADFSAYGPNIDLLAPGVENAIYTLSNTGSLNSGNNLYRTFSGTSAAAPHTSGVAALMLSLHNPDYNPTYPNHLGQEDVEYILKNTAKPILNDPDHPNNSPNLPVPNQYSGNGLLNAYQSLMHSSLPYRVHHFDFKVNKDAGIIYVSNQNVEFPEGIDGIPSGSQILQTTVYEVTYTFTHNLPLNEIFIDGWIRNASSDLYSLEDTLFNSHWSGVKIDAIDESNATLTGYYYITEVLTNGNTSIVISPEPDINDDFRFAYSVYTKDTSYHLKIDENHLTSDEITVFPNPTNDVINVLFSNNRHDLNIYDIMGRKIQNFNIENSSDKSLKVDISTLPQGMYLFIFNKGGSTITKKIIKQ
jgi:subtilisin family serine protease